MWGAVVHGPFLHKFTNHFFGNSLNLRTGQPPAECEDSRYCIIQFDLIMSTEFLKTYRIIINLL